MNKILFFLMLYFTSIQILKAQYGFNYTTFNINEKFERIDSLNSRIYFKSIQEIILENDTNIWVKKTSIDNKDFIYSRLKIENSVIKVISFSNIGIHGYNKTRPQEYIKFNLVLKEKELIFDGEYSRFTASNDDTLETGLYSNGNRIGLWKFFNNGNKIFQTKYYFGESYNDFIQTRYYENNKKEYEYKVLNNLYEDTFFYFHYNGTIMIKGCYRKGIRVGEWNFYHSNGNLLTQGYYTGKYIQKSVFNCELFGDNFSKSSSLFPKSEMMRINTKKGKWKYWDANKQLIKHERYAKNGTLKKVKYHNDVFIANSGIYYELNGLFIDER